MLIEINYSKFKLLRKRFDKNIIRKFKQYLYQKNNSIKEKSLYK